MTLKEFVKSFSIYGFLPVFTKFAGFLLVPIYVRVLSQYDYGIAELILSSITFLIYLMNMEFYGAVGRFYFDREDHAGRQNLISTGFYLTLFSAVFVAMLCLVFQDALHDMLFSKGEYHFELRLGLLWAVITAISTYLSILPRYEKKAKRYVLYNMISVSVRLLSTILFVVSLKLGIRGILYGQIIGAACSTVLYAWSSQKYFVARMTIPEAREIARFALPLVPGVVLIGLYQPLMRIMISRIYDVQTLALFSFAYRIVTIIALVQTGIRLSWRPILFENIRKASFGKEYRRISDFSGTVILLAGIAIVTFAREMVSVLGTSQYVNSLQMIGLLVLATVFFILETVRGFGFEVVKKTYFITIINSVSRGLGLLFLWLVAPRFKLIGIGIAFLIPPLIDYLVKVNYTRKLIQLKGTSWREAMLWLLIACGVVFSIQDFHLVFRTALLLVSLAVALSPDRLSRIRERLSHQFTVRKKVDQNNAFMDIDNGISE